MASDAELKTTHATRMMLIARELAAAASGDRQQRIIARYVLLHADSVHRWARCWRGEHGRRVDGSAEECLRRWRREFGKQKKARDKIAVRRQAVEERRADDLRATLALWQSLTYAGGTRLCDAACAVCHALGADPALLDAAVAPNVLHDLGDALRAAQMKPTVVYIDVTSYAAGEPNLLPVAMTGKGGRRITQINDVHDNLDMLYLLRRLLHRTDDVGLFLRAALIVELYSLIELVIGPPSGAAPVRDGPPLLGLVDRRRGAAGYQLLDGIRVDVIANQTHENLPGLRDRVAAHLGTQLPYREIVNVLLSLDVESLFREADKVLDVLDAAARAHVDLGYLVLGHPELKRLKPIGRNSIPATFLSNSSATFLDQPFGCIVGAGFGPTASAFAVAAVARRVATPRARWTSSN